MIEWVSTDLYTWWSLLNILISFRNAIGGFLSLMHGHWSYLRNAIVGSISLVERHLIYRWYIIGGLQWIAIGHAVVIIHCLLL